MNEREQIETRLKELHQTLSSIGKLNDELLINAILTEISELQEQMKGLSSTPQTGFKKGCLILSSLKNSGAPADRKYFAVRHPGKINLAKYHLILKQEIAPSTELFNRVAELKEKGEWNTTTYETMYRPIFIEEMKSLKARNALNEIAKELNSGLNVMIICFCPTEEFCHRKILGEMFEAKGYEIIH